MPEPTFSTCVESPLGNLTLVGTYTQIYALLFENQAPQVPAQGKSNQLLDEASRQLDEYFHGSRLEFCLPLRNFPATFSGRAQLSLADIPSGHTWTYAQLASSAGSPGAVRAAGSACARNPLPLLLPCHRVVRSNGEIGNYRGGKWAKQWLLSFEKAR